MTNQREPLLPEQGFWYTPAAGVPCSSPFIVDGFHLVGEEEEKVLTAYFHGVMYSTRIKRDYVFNTKTFSFEFSLPPGPCYAEWDVKWRTHWREMADIGWLYIVTPPEN
ncbi:hypothetical protein D3C87_1552090 [compost metagenome]